MILKMTREKSNAFQKTFKNLNSFLDDVENAKNGANILKTYFLDFRCFSLFLDFFQKLNKKMGQNLGSNRCPFFTMLTQQNSSMFCIVSFIKTRKKNDLIILGDLPLLKKNGLFLGVTSPHTHTSLFSQATCPHTLIVVYFQGDQPTHTQSGLFSGATSPYTHTGLFSWATCPHTLKVVYFHRRPAHTRSQ